MQNVLERMEAIGAERKMAEEAADVYNVLGLLLDAEDNVEIYDIIRRKKARWLNRLEG